MEKQQGQHRGQKPGHIERLVHPHVHSHGLKAWQMVYRRNQQPTYIPAHMEKKNFPALLSLLPKNPELHVTLQTSMSDEHE